MTEPTAARLADLLNAVREDSPPEARQMLSDALESAVPAVTPGADRVHYTAADGGVVAWDHHLEQWAAP